MKTFYYAAFLACTTSSVVSAYELATHARITQQAYSESSLSKDASLLSILGVADYGPNRPFGDYYYEISNNSVTERPNTRFIFDKEVFPPEISRLSLSPQGWLMRGAIREDDYQEDNFPCETSPPNPQDENPLNRPLNHFYDPVNDQAVSLTSQKATDWGLGTSNAISNPNQEDTGRANPYTLFDAREAMYRAVTGQTTSGLPDIAPNGSGGARAPLDAAEGEQVRKAYWATTFRILGDLVHLIEDMAQPQHTRGDPHLSDCSEFAQALVGGKSLYESYVDQRAKREDLIVPSRDPSSEQGDRVSTRDLIYTSYPIPRFNDYLSYFTTRHNMIDEHHGRDSSLRRSIQA